MLLLANTFSKNWAMTGWRAGWVIYPRGLAPTFAKLGQYSTTSIPTSRPGRRTRSCSPRCW